MLLVISGVLSTEEAAEARAQAADLDWSDGANTAGPKAAAVKRNQQADLSSRGGAQLHRTLRSKIERHAVVQAAARPRRLSKLLISRTLTGGGYGAHVDNALMGEGAARLRTDVSFTLFLSEPDAFAGGELALDLPGARQIFKPAAGDLVLYPSGAIHAVEPVTSGERLACVGWIESDIPDPAKREILFDLANFKASLTARGGGGEDNALLLDKTMSNLVRMWSVGR